MDPILPHAPNDDLGHYLQLMVAHGASDLFLSGGSAAALAVQALVRGQPVATLGARPAAERSGAAGGVTLSAAAVAGARQGRQ